MKTRIYRTGEWGVYHRCPKLRECAPHPRWHVIKIAQGWYAISPGTHNSTRHTTHTEAINHAQKQATK